MWELDSFKMEKKQLQVQKVLQMLLLTTLFHPAETLTICLISHLHTSFPLLTTFSSKAPIPLSITYQYYFIHTQYSQYLSAFCFLEVLLLGSSVLLFPYRRIALPGPALHISPALNPLCPQLHASSCMINPFI